MPVRGIKLWAFQAPFEALLILFRRLRIKTNVPVTRARALAPEAGSISGADQWGANCAIAAAPAPTPSRTSPMTLHIEFLLFPDFPVEPARYPYVIVII